MITRGIVAPIVLNGFLRDSPIRSRGGRTVGAIPPIGRLANIVPDFGLDIGRTGDFKSVPISDLYVSAGELSPFERFEFSNPAPISNSELSWWLSDGAPSGITWTTSNAKGDRDVTRNVFIGGILFGLGSSAVIGATTVFAGRRQV